ncbi:MAG: hypothetical protein QW051_01195 [Candidatus Aenigmatarchaeota archaeon]
MDLEQLKNNYIRDRIYMAFGSMCNAYGQTMKPQNIQEFESDMRVLFRLSAVLVKELYEQTSPKQKETIQPENPEYEI